MKFIFKTTVIIIFIFSINFSLFSEDVSSLKKGESSDIESEKTDVKKKDKAAEVSDDSFYPYSTNDDDMKPLLQSNSFFTKGIQYGGWLTPVIVSQESGDLSLTTSINTVKLWVKGYLWENSFLYIRGKNVFQKIISQEGYDFDTVDNLLDLDVGFISMSDADKTVNFTAGRKFFILGTGVVFNGRGDGAELNLYSKYLYLKLFGAYTGLLMKDNNPYGMSDKDISDGAKRVFLAGSLSTDFVNQTFYIFSMFQIDRSEEDPGENIRYNSGYHGLGIKGVFLNDFSYYAEFIYETGKSYLSGRDEKEDIKAKAFIFGLNYFLDSILNPSLSFQYAYGSGDENRLNYKNSTGNDSGADTGFINFGTFSGGYALRPLLGNLHIIRGGFSITPLSETGISSIKKISLISKVNYYLKDKPEASINYGEATEPERFVGYGFDVSIRWRIFYDLTAFANYGIFIPGDAYASTEKNKNFMMIGLNLSF